jgi:hypothetical protein
MSEKAAKYTRVSLHAGLSIHRRLHFAVGVGQKVYMRVGDGARGDVEGVVRWERRHIIRFSFRAYESYVGLLIDMY